MLFEVLSWTYNLPYISTYMACYLGTTSHNKVNAKLCFSLFIFNFFLSQSLSLSLFGHSQLVLFGNYCLTGHFLVWWLSCPKYPLLWSEGLQCADDCVVASGEEKEDPGGEDEGQGEDGEVEGEQDGGEGWVENHGDKNCKQMQGERSGMKIIKGVLNLFFTLSTYEDWGDHIFL